MVSAIFSVVMTMTPTLTAASVPDRYFKERGLDYVVPSVLPEDQEYFFLCHVYIGKKHPVMIVSHFLGLCHPMPGLLYVFSKTT